MKRVSLRAPVLESRLSIEEDEAGNLVTATLGATLGGQGLNAAQGSVSLRNG